MTKPSKRRWNNPLTMAMLMLSAVFIVLSTGIFKPKPSVKSGVVGRAMQIDLRGPNEIESHSVFLDYRVNLIMRHDDGSSVRVPAYFAADGNAAETGAISGSVWRAHFVPPKSGRWSYRVDFKTGGNIAINDGIGKPLRKFDGARGAFSVAAAKANVTDRRLFDTQSRYLQRSDGTPFIQTGVGRPNNILAYTHFDGTYDVGGPNGPAQGATQLHRFDTYMKHANIDDPTWRDGKGAAILGVANAYKNLGVNAQTMVAMTIDGDGQAVFPYVDHTDPYVFDVSKLAQWQRVLDHFNDQSVLIDMVLTETENDSWFEVFDGLSAGEDFAPLRKLYYREMVARFGHLPMLVWTLGEENDSSDNRPKAPYAQPTTAAQHREFANYIRKLDPQDHAIDSLSDIKLQVRDSSFKTVMTSTQKAQAAGRAWRVTVEAPLSKEASAGAKNVEADNSHAIKQAAFEEGAIERAIETVLWPVLLAGGAGVDWSFDGQYNASPSHVYNKDQDRRDTLLKTSAKVRAFFEDNFDMNSLRASISEDGTQTQTTLVDKQGHRVVISMSRTKTPLPDGEGHVSGTYDLDSLTLSHQGVVTTLNPLAPSLRLHSD